MSYAIVSIVSSFLVLVVFDFVSGLIDLWSQAGKQVEEPTAEPTAEPTIPESLPMAIATLETVETMEELKQKAKELGIKGWNLYKDERRLKEKILNVSAQ